MAQPEPLRRAGKDDMPFSIEGLLLVADSSRSPFGIHLQPDASLRHPGRFEIAVRVEDEPPMQLDPEIVGGEAARLFIERGMPFRRADRVGPGLVREKTSRLPVGMMSHDQVQPGRHRLASVALPLQLPQMKKLQRQLRHERGGDHRARLFVEHPEPDLRGEHQRDDIFARRFFRLPEVRLREEEVRRDLRREDQAGRRGGIAVDSDSAR